MAVQVWNRLERTHLLPLEDLRDDNLVLFIQPVDDHPACVVVARRPRDVEHAVAAGRRLDVVAWATPHKSLRQQPRRNSVHMPHTPEAPPRECARQLPLLWGIFKHALFTSGSPEETIKRRWKLAGRARQQKKHTKAATRSLRRRATNKQRRLNLECAAVSSAGSLVLMAC